MRPSFFSLFKRGKYYHRSNLIATDSKANDTKGDRECKELERYTVSAIAFCLQHDDEFRQQFFSRVCRRPGDPKLHRWAIEIEPHAWGDLVLHNQCEVGHFVYAVECKIDAFLDDHQNPEKATFCEQKGYGRVLAAAEKNALLCYTVLGYRKPLRIPESFPYSQLRAQQRYWASISDSFTPTGITLDLFNSLGHLGVPEFSYRHTDNMKMGSHITEAAKAGQIIAHVANQFNLLPEYIELEPWYENDDEWCFGYIVKRLPPTQGKSEAQRRLMKVVAVDPNQTEIAWFGYEADASKRRKLSVYLYCGGRKAAAANYDLLFKKYPQITKTEREDSHVVDLIISTNTNNESSDRKWFSSVFETLGLKTCN